MNEGHIALGISILLAVLTIYKEISSSSRTKVIDTKDDDKWKTTIETRLGILEFRIGDVWDRLGKMSAAGLHQPHPQNYEMDQLIEKYTNDALDDNELMAFIRNLEDIKENGSFLDRERAKNVLRAIEEKYQVK